MAWDAVITGELTFASAADVERWTRARAIVAKAKWPSMLAPDDDVVGSDRGVVRDLVTRLGAIEGGPKFFEIETKGATATVRGFLDEDTYRDVASDLVALISAAAVSAKGRVDVRNASALTGGGVELDGKRIRGRDLARTLSAEDQRRVDAVFDRIAARTPAPAPLPYLHVKDPDERDRAQIAWLEENHARRPAADVKDAIQRVEARMKARAKKRAKKK